MPDYKFSVTIERPLPEVHNYATTPAWWPLYHDDSLRITPPIDHSPAVGAKFVEHATVYTARFLKWDIHWEVTENDGDKRCVYSGTSKDYGGAVLKLIYSFAETEGGAEFVREFRFRENLFIMRILSALFFNRSIKQSGQKSLETLKGFLESVPPF